MNWGKTRASVLVPTDAGARTSVGRRLPGRGLVGSSRSGWPTARLEPFGSEADDHALAQLLALIANVNRDPKRRKTPWTPEDFLPPRGHAGRGESRDLRPRIDAAMAAFGGVRKR